MEERYRKGKSLRTYEAVFLLLPNLEEASIQSLGEKFSSQVVQGGGQVIKVDRQGKRRLAYSIRGVQEGYFVVMEFQAEPPVAKELERVLRINEEILRSLVVRLN